MLGYGRLHGRCLHRGGYRQSSASGLELISPEFHEAHAEVEWQRIAGTRENAKAF